MCRGRSLEVWEGAKEGHMSRGAMRGCREHVGVKGGPRGSWREFLGGV